MSTALKVRTLENEKFSWNLFPGLCKGCGLCMEKCPQQCMSWSQANLGVYGTPTVEPKMEECIGCGICSNVCPDCAISVAKKKK